MTSIRERDENKLESVKLCETVGFNIITHWNETFNCTKSEDCGIEPPAMTHECPKCPFNQKGVVKVGYASVDFSDLYNLDILVQVLQDMGLSILWDSSRKEWDVGNGDGTGDTLLKAVNRYVETLQACIEDGDDVESADCSIEFNKFKTLMKSRSWRELY